MNRWSKGEPDLISTVAGALHWTQATARPFGSGMIHEEIPTQPGTSCHGLNRWSRCSSNSPPAADELTPPEAFHLDPNDVIELTPEPGVRIRLLAGRLGDHGAGIGIRNDLTLAEIHLQPEQNVTIPAPSKENSFIFVQRGIVITSNHRLEAAHACAFDHDGDTITLTAGADHTSLIYGSGKPLDEPLHQRGSFIMSSPQRLDQAEIAYRQGNMGRLNPSF